MNDENFGLPASKPEGRLVDSETGLNCDPLYGDMDEYLNNVELPFILNPFKKIIFNLLKSTWENAVMASHKYHNANEK